MSNTDHLSPGQSLVGSERIEDGERWLCAEVYIGGRGFVAVWVAHSDGRRRYEDLDVKIVLPRPRGACVACGATISPLVEYCLGCTGENEP